MGTVGQQRRRCFEQLHVTGCSSQLGLMHHTHHHRPDAQQIQQTVVASYQILHVPLHLVPSHPPPRARTGNDGRAPRRLPSGSGFEQGSTHLNHRHTEQRAQRVALAHQERSVLTRQRHVRPTYCRPCLAQHQAEEKQMGRHAASEQGCSFHHRCALGQFEGLR